MQSLAYIPASNGIANASLMTVQTVRAANAPTITVNTVAGASAKFYGSMGTPHTFTDPQTGETITIISESTAVDFAGSVSGSTINIDAIAPGYTDTGSKVGDIIVIRPITEWANNIFNALSQSLNDNGSLKAAAVTYNPNVGDYVQTGGIWSTVSGLNGAMTALTAWQGGYQGTIAAIAARAYTASKDTYVDVLRTLSGYTNTFTLVYTEVANGAASPALAANSIRIAKVVTNGTAITSIVQGGLDSLGNFMLPLRVGTKTVDANGWTVYEQGGSRRYVKRFPTAFAVTQGIGANAVAGPFGEASGLPLPVGIASLAQVFCKVTGGMLSGGDVISLGINQTDMTTSNVTPNVYAHNTYNTTVNIQKVIIEMELLTM